MARRISYRIQVLDTLVPWGWARHMKVQREDGKGGITWDELQRLKDQYLGTDTTAVEFFPTAAQVVDELNMRHLWEVPKQMLPMNNV